MNAFCATIGYTHWTHQRMLCIRHGNKGTQFCPQNVEKYRITYGSLWKTMFLRVRWFVNYCVEWRSHEWKLLANHLTSGQKLVIHDRQSIFYFLNALTRFMTQRNRWTMMTSSNGSVFRVTGLLWGESTGQQWIPLTKASDAELWCFLWICAWTNGWANNRDAVDLRHNRVHYDVNIMASADRSARHCCWG